MTTANCMNHAAQAALLSIAATLLPQSAAFAHANLVSEVPAANAQVSPAPKQLSLKFSEGVALKFTGVTITGPDKKAVAVGPDTLDPKDPATLIVPITGALAAGTYQVNWHALSNDVIRRRAPIPSW
jgi:copper resistance protein C